MTSRMFAWAPAAALAMMVALPAPAWALGGGVGCADLPDYERATGVLEGIPSGCDMSREEANRIVRAHDAAEGGPRGLYDPAEARRMQAERARAARPR